METTDTRHKSRTILDGRNRAPARSSLKGMGFSEEDLSKPIVGVAHSWIETMPCNFNHRHLADVEGGVAVSARVAARGPRTRAPSRSNAPSRFKVSCTPMRRFGLSGWSSR